MPPHVCSQCAILQQQTSVRPQKGIHLSHRVEPIKATAARGRQHPLKATLAHPCVHIPICTIEQPLYLGHKLPPTTVAEARGQECRCLLIRCPFHLMHKPRRVALQEGLRLILRGISPQIPTQKFVYHTCYHQIKPIFAIPNGPTKIRLFQLPHKKRLTATVAHLTICAYPKVAPPFNLALFWIFIAF